MTFPHSKSRTVLVYPGGTEIGLEIARSLKLCKEVRLVSAGMRDTPADFFFSKHYEVEPISSQTWSQQLKSAIEAERVTHILPAHDEVIVPLLENERLLGAKIVASGLETCRVARSKRETVKRLTGVLPVPTIFDVSSAVEDFPVFLKPDRGQGSRGALVARTREELDVALARDASLVIQEYLPGEEYTVDCFSDREKGLLYAAGRKRIKITSGIASRSQFVQNTRFADYARRIHKALPFWGAWFFQLKASAEGELKLLEVAPRIAGTSGLSRTSGVNLPLLGLYESDRIEVSIPNELLGIIVERSLAPAYSHTIEYEALYLDYDDTLIVGGAVNSQLVKIAYQCLNRKKAVVLVTRHAGDISASLQKYRLGGLFDQIVHLKAGESKRKAITHGKCVFVDDSFRELEDIRRHPGVTALHVSSADLLINYRGI
jgi:carbamoyl-phosphate synthase large subunit